MPSHLDFSGFLQPPSVPPDPAGDSWRGPQGFPGAPGPPGTGELLPVTITETVVALSSVDTTILPANSNRKYLGILNIGTGLASLGIGSAVTAGNGWALAAAGTPGDQGGGFEQTAASISLQAIHGICAAGVTTSVVVLEGV